MVTGKQPIVINKPVPGFLFNRLQVIGYIVLVASGILVHHMHCVHTVPASITLATGCGFGRLPQLA